VIQGLFRPQCIVCKKTTASIEVIPPHELPQEWEEWEADRKERFLRSRNPDKFYLQYAGPGGGNGAIGDPIDPEEAQRIVDAFSQPVDAERIRKADFYDNAGLCMDCTAFYCFEHWSTTSTGYGTCPKGHGASLDPHWSPDFDFDD
jgi:hypothetical protein